MSTTTALLLQTRTFTGLGDGARPNPSVPQQDAAVVSDGWQRALIEAKGEGDRTPGRSAREPLRPLAQPFAAPMRVAAAPDTAGQVAAVAAPTQAQARTSSRLALDTAQSGLQPSPEQDVDAAGSSASPSTDTSDRLGHSPAAAPAVWLARIVARDSDMEVLMVDDPERALPLSRSSIWDSALSPRVEADDAVDATSFPAESTATPADARLLAERDPLRLHAQWSEQGVRIWLGADALTPAALAVVAERVRHWIGSRGERLLSLVCNGRTVFGALTPEAGPIATDAHAGAGALSGSHQRIEPSPH